MAYHSKPMQLTEEALQELEACAQNNPDPIVRKRAAMVLAVAKGGKVMEVAEQLSAGPNTVLGWKKRYEENGLAGLDSLPPGKRKSADGPTLGERVRAALNGPPPWGSSFWTAALLSRELDVPVADIRKYLKRAEIDLTALRQSHAAEGAVPSGDIPADPEKVPHPADTERQSGACAETSHGGPHNVRIIIQEEDDAGDVLAGTHILLEHILADAQHFDVRTVDGFQRDWNLAEQGIANGFLQLLQAFLTGHVDAAKKNSNESLAP